jgi:hypothetical protein
MDINKLIVESIFPFIPNSSGDEKLRLVLALRGNKNYTECLLHLAKAVNITLLEENNIEEAMPGEFAELKELFDSHGSDKARDHNYHLLYGTILNQRNEIKNVLEIGLGTQNPEILSFMSNHEKDMYKPGSSLRAFRDYLPNANIFGADIDKEILFEEERIKTFYVDQLNPDLINELMNNIPDDMDLIIDDGLHNPEANIKVIVGSLHKIKVGGWLVIEDIHNTAMDIWKVVSLIIPNNYNKYLLRAKKGNLFAIQRMG